MRLLPMQGALHFGMASGAMLVAFGLCEGLHHLTRMEPSLQPHPHALFFPHGVVVVFGWMYGWAAMPLLYPAALLSVWLMNGPIALDPVVMGVLGAKLVAVPLAFDIFRLAGMDARGAGTAASWKMLVAVGLLGAILGNVPRVAVGPCCGEMGLADRLVTYANTVAGDMAGLIAVLVAVMLFFRALRQG